jgi:excisionase family DNA binding protein
MHPDAIYVYKCDFMAPLTQAQPQREPEFTVREAAKRLGVDRSTVLRWASSGLINVERSMIGLVVKDSELQRVRHAGRPGRGRPIGVSESPPSTVERILALRAEGLAYAEVARRLNAEGVPTARAGRAWWASSVRSVCVTANRGRA